MRGRPDDGAWTDKDRIMALALTAYEAALCAGCGLHPAVTRGDHNVGRWEAISDDICQGCEPIESFMADKNRDTFPGQKVHLTEVEGFAG